MKNLSFVTKVSPNLLLLKSIHYQKKRLNLPAQKGKNK